MIYLIMGVSGSGKTTVGTSLSKTFSVPFYDADDYHNHKNTIGNNGRIIF